LSNATPIMLKVRSELPKSLIPLVLSILFWISDFSATFSNIGKFQYVPLALMLLMYLYQYNLGNFRVIDLSLQNIWIFLFLGYGIFGILIGKLYFGAVNGPLPLVLPWLLMSFTVLDFREIESTTRLFKYIASLILISNILIILARNKVFPFLDIFQFSHENSYMIPIALGSSLIARSKKLLFLNLITISLMFRTYPAGTYVISFAITVIYLLAFYISRNRKITILFLSLVWLCQAYFIYVVTFRFSRVLFSSNYVYTLLGKSDNGIYRKFLSEILLIKYYESPVFGSGFAGEILVNTRFSIVPAHNDYLTILVAGGMVALTIFLLLIFSIQYSVLQLLSFISEFDKKILFTLMCSVNIYLVSMSVNPIGMKTFNCLIFVSTLFCIRSISESYKSTHKIS